jgi:hypothetical protein
MKKIAKCSENSGLQRKYHYPQKTHGSTHAQPYEGNNFAKTLERKFFKMFQ